jgi:hypothetical protein
LDELLALVKQAVADSVDDSSRSMQANKFKTGDGGGFVRCPSRPMQLVYDLLEKAAPSDKTILIQGETGVGKDVLAYQIHCSSLRKAGPFITVDCGLLNRNLAESELYGHGKGAFSGATERKMGLVEQSIGGTLFLDEIGNIDMELQKKFLRFLEHRKFRRVGETREIAVDTRFVLATNLDLNDAVRKGVMRQDLFYRMGVIDVEIPPPPQPPSGHRLSLSTLSKDGARPKPPRDHPSGDGTDPDGIRLAGEREGAEIGDQQGDYLCRFRRHHAGGPAVSHPCRSQDPAPPPQDPGRAGKGAYPVRSR